MGAAAATATAPRVTLVVAAKSLFPSTAAAPQIVVRGRGGVGG